MARGLRLVYPTVRCEFDSDLEVAQLRKRVLAETGEERILDPHIIEWLGERNGIWIHADDSAKREHAKLIIARDVRTMWVYRPTGKLSAREQMRIVGYVLPQLLQKFEDQWKQRHYDVRTDGHFPYDKIKLIPHRLEPL